MSTETGVLHYWEAGKHPLATMCAACKRPMVPSPAPDDWRRHLNEYGNAYTCTGSGMYFPTPSTRRD